MEKWEGKVAVVTGASGEELSRKNVEYLRTETKDLCKNVNFSFRDSEELQKKMRSQAKAICRF